MKLRDLFDKIADDQEPQGVLDQSLQAVAAVGSSFYGAGSSASRILHSFGILERKSLGVTTLSVGNITMGGTGKTPFTIWLSRFIQKEGRNPVILSRGYGRADEDSLRIVHNGRRLRSDVENGGDEPVLMAKALGNVPVISDSNRYRGGKYAEKKMNIDVAILDDGMQHHRLERQGEFVLLDATKPLERLHVVPRGSLREPLSGLKRAHLIVITRCDQSRNLKLFLKRLRNRCPSIPMVRTKFALTGFDRVANGESVSVEDVKKRKAYLVCAVGNPESVAGLLRSNGIKVVGNRYYDDHASFTKRDLMHWRRAAKNAGASQIIVTGKDAVKLTGFEKIPSNILSMNIELEFLNARDQSIAENTVRSRLRLSPVLGYLK